MGKELFMSNKNPLISVVVPVYNVEDFLSRCVESILAQTYKNFELILVDDGSPDRCGQICDDYALRDKRITVIHKKNGGLSEARNFGTQVSRGEYITYIDSDDWVSPVYLEILYGILLDNNADVSICNEIKLSKEKVINNKKSSVCVFSGITALTDMLYQRTLDNCACCKLFKVELMKRNFFPVGKLYEDLFTTYKVFTECKKIVYTDAIFYYYWSNPESIMNLSFTPRMFDEIDAVNEIELFIKDNYPMILPAALSRKFSSYCQVYRWMCKGKSSPLYDLTKRELWEFIKSYRGKMIFDKGSRLKNRLAALISFMGPFLFGVL